MRAYVGGESRWSKGQKDAIHHLYLYGETGDDHHYEQYQKAIAGPLGDRAARIALERNPPDLVTARTGFLQGGIHPSDVDGVIWLYRYFRELPIFKTALVHWISTDPLLDELTDLAKTIQLEQNGTPVSPRSSLRCATGSTISTHASLLKRWPSPKISATRRARFSACSLSATCSSPLARGGAVSVDPLLLSHSAANSSRALRAEKERAQITLASIGDAVISTDAQGRVEYMNPAAERLVARRMVEARGVPLSFLFKILDEESGQQVDGQIARILDGYNLTATTRPQLLQRHDATSVPISMVGTPLYKEGAIAGAVLVLHDMTSEKKYIARLSWQASHDSLTKLANRREFEHRLDQALQRLDKGQVRLHALMYLDLDQFKIINDTCGHAAGDKLLCEVAASLQQHIRSNDLLARLGGDEFAILLENGDLEQAAIVAERLRQAVRGHELRLGTIALSR